MPVGTRDVHKAWGIVDDYIKENNITEHEHFPCYTDYHKSRIIFSGWYKVIVYCMKETDKNSSIQFEKMSSGDFYIRYKAEGYFWDRIDKRIRKITHNERCTQREAKFIMVEEYLRKFLNHLMEKKNV